MWRIGEVAYKNNQLIRHNSGRLDAQQKVLAIAAMEEADAKLKMVGLEDKFEKLTDRTAQRLAIIDWIHNNLEESVQQ